MFKGFKEFFKVLVSTVFYGTYLEYSSISLLVAFCEGASHHFISSLTPANLKQDDS